MRRKGNFTGKRNQWLFAAIFSGLLFASSSFAQADFLSFNFSLNPTFSETINTTTRVIDVEVYNSADVSSLVAVFSASPNSVVRIGATVQTSGQTVNDFTSQVTYLITSADGSVTREWYVNVTKKAPSVEKVLTMFQFASIGATATIGSDDHTVYISVPHSQDVTSLVASFVISPLATMSLDGVVLVSGVTASDYTGALEENGDTKTLVVKAENGSTRNYYISVKRDAALSGKEISYFAFEALDPDVDGDIDQVNSTITLTVPFQTNVTNLVSTFTSPYLSTVKVGTVIQQSGLTPNDFTSPVAYTVIAEDGTTKVYTVTVNKAAASSEKVLQTFKITNIEPQVTGTINGDDFTVVATIPYAADITTLVVNFTSSIYSQVTVNNVLQVSGVTPNDFTNSVIYTVTAQDGSTQNYTVTVTQQAASQENDFLSFNLEAANNAVLVHDVTGSINLSAKTVTLSVPYGTNVSALIATFTNSLLSSVTINELEQVSGISIVDFTSPVQYTITAEDGSSEIFTVSVNQTAASQDNDLITFKFKAVNNGSLTGDRTAAIDQTTKTATVYVPFSTTINTLIATFVISDYATAKVGSVTQVSDVTINNFTNNVVFAVIAQDGSTELYTIIVIVEANTEKRFLNFSLQAFTPAIHGTIDEGIKTITAQVPNSTDRSALVVTFTISENAEAYIGGIKQVSGTTVNDFTGVVIYTVHAANGTTQDYNVIITNLPVQTGKAITDFRFNAFSPVVVGSINEVDHTIAAEVPLGTDLTGLVASFTNSLLSTVSVGSVIQVSGTTANDFTSTVSYLVTAEDGSTQTYLVTVSTAPASTEKNMLQFAFESFDPDVIGVISETSQTIMLVVPHYTDLTQLVASYTVSEYATVKIQDGGYQQSGITINDFSEAVVYEVYAQDGSMKSYLVIVNEQADVVPPVVTAEAQNVTNELAQFVLASSNERTGKVYIVHESAAQASVSDLEAAIAVSKGKSALVQAANQEVPISTYSLVEGTYYAYAVDGSGNMSEKGLNAIVIVDELAPTVYVNTQTISNAPNKYVLAQSNENNSFIYLIKEGVPQAIKSDLEVAVSARNGVKVFAPVAATNASLLVSGLNPGAYHAYAIDQNNNLSSPSVAVVNVIAASRLKALTSFSFQTTQPVSIGAIAGNVISVEVPNGTNLASLVASYTISPGAKAYIGLIEQVSGVSSNDFVSPVTYTVEAEDGSTQNYIVTVTEETSGIENIDWSLAVNLYPNPVSDLLSIDFAQIPDRLVISNILGHTVYDNTGINDSKIGVDVSSWSSGIYLVRLMKKGEVVHHKKIIKQ